MMHSVPLDEPVDLAALGAFLASDRAPPDCMQLAELDGFLAGIVVSPEMILPSHWLHEIWHGGEPEFADLDEMSAIMGMILRRYNEIIHQLDTDPDAYRPRIATGDAGGTDASDWALGFLRAMTLCQGAWLSLMDDSKAGVLLSPIMLIASTTKKANLPLDPGRGLPPAEMTKLLTEADQLLGMCVSGMHAFFRARGRKPPGKPARRKRGGRAKAKRR